MAGRLATVLDLSRIELDEINWQAGWRDLVTHDKPEFIRRVDAATAAERWVCDGNYSVVFPLVLGRATHLVWLDYGPATFMPRVIGRSVMRALDRRELWNGNHENWRDWLDKDHPMLWAWRTWRDRRARYEAMIASDACAHLAVHRLRHPREAAPLVQRLAAEAAVTQYGG